MPLDNQVLDADEAMSLLQLAELLRGRLVKEAYSTRQGFPA